MDPACAPPPPTAPGRSPPRSRPLDTLLKDLGYAVRTLVRRPGFTALATLTVAIGIGANTAIFTVVDAVLLRPLPYPEPDRLVAVWEEDRARGWDRVPASAEDFLEWRREVRTLEALAAGSGASFSLTSEGTPEQVPGFRVTADFFRVFGVDPLLGRPFGPESTVEGAHRRVVLSHGLWQRRYGADPGIVGRTVQVDGEGHEVVAVMPPGFHFPSTAQLWAPLVFSEAQLQDRNWHFLMPVGRLAPGKGIEEARTELRALAARLEQEFPGSNQGWGADVFPLHGEMTQAVRSTLWVLLGAVGFVLLIACANVANLLLVRAAGRTRELAVRSALGAGRGRLARQLLTESLLLAAMGGAVGLGLAAWTLDLLVAMSPITVPGGGSVTIDGGVLAVTAAATLVTGLLFGTVPALALLRTDLQGSLKDGGRGTGSGGGRRMRSGLVVAEIGLALVLVTGAGLMVQSVRSLLDVDVGLRAGGLLLAQFSLPQASHPEPAERVLFYDQLLERLRGIPGAEAAALTSVAPPASGGQYHVRIEGVHDAWTMDLPVARARAVSPGYFEAMGIPLVRGRLFTAQDREGSERVVVVDQAFADQHFPGEDPLGRRIRTLEDEPRTIIGVVGNVANTGLGNAAQPTDYIPYAQTPFGNAMTLAVRTGGDPHALVPSVQDAVWGLDPDLPLVGVESMEDRIGNSVNQPRFNSTLLTLFAALALGLAGVGVYGVTSFTVGERTRELGLRMALGATSREVRRLVLGGALGLAGGGVLLGIAVSLALGRLLSGLLFGIEPTDPWTLTAVAAVLCGMAVLAAWIPARRASRVDPLVALRSE